MSNVKQLKQNEFDNMVLKSDKPVLVDFSATWCGPCRMLAPVIDSLAEDYKDKVNVYQVDVDECGSIAQRYGIMSIPTVLTFNNGELNDRTVGLTQKGNLEKLISKML